MTLDRDRSNERKAEPSVFLTGEAESSCQDGNAIYEIDNLDQALRLAAKLHYGVLAGSDSELCSIVEKLKRLAVRELDKGDGRKVESVRVERRLDGSVSVFFGI